MAASMNHFTVSPSSPGVVVWEWQNEFQRWRPYDPHIVQYIEQNRHNQSGLLPLGNVETSLHSYSIDLKSNVQLRHQTGTQRPIRRSVLPPLSAPGQGVAWQWEGDQPGAWHTYDLDISEVLEKAFKAQQHEVDLNHPPFSLPYKVSLLTMTQTRLETRRMRTIRRERLPVCYPADVSVTSLVNHQSTLTNLSVPPKKRGRSSYVNIDNSTPYSLRKKKHMAPGASLGRSISLPPNTVPSVSSAAALPPVLPHAYAAHFAHLSHLHHLNSSSVPGNLSGVASGLSLPPVNLQPAMTGVTNILMSPAVPTAPQSMSHYYSLPTSRSVPSLQNPYLLWPKNGKSHHKIRNDIDHSNGRKDTAEDVLSKYVSVISDIPKDEDCCICCEKLCEVSGFCNTGVDGVVYRLDRCSHHFHKLCLHQMYDSGQQDGSIQCPTCKTIYGVKCGNCPKGEMEYECIPNHLPGYTCGTIQIRYNIKPGIQGPDHPHPGNGYSARGFPRFGFLPDNPDGQKVLKLLVVAWKRRLTFTIGQSTTTGEGDTVTWNEIHHKTEFSSNSTGHGYPDPNYITNVLMELAVHGVTEADLE